MPTLPLALDDRWSRNWRAAFRYLRAGPGHFFMYVFGRFRVVRGIMVRAYQLRRSNAAAVPGPSSIERVDIDDAVRTISEDGLFAGFRLVPGTLEELRHFSLTQSCFGEENSQFPFYVGEKKEAEQRYRRKFHVGRFDECLKTCPAVRALASDAKLIAIARKYFGVEPVLLGARMWWSFADSADSIEQTRHGQSFHYDIDGYRALAFFFYLSDVDHSAGPHIYIKGSHRKKPLNFLFSLYKARSDAEITKYYGSGRQVTVCGPAGFGFAEDIFSFHKGLHPESCDRLMLQIRYGIRRYGKAAY